MTLFPCKLAYSALLGLDSTFPKLDKNVAKRLVMQHSTPLETALWWETTPILKLTMWRRFSGIVAMLLCIAVLGGAVTPFTAHVRAQSSWTTWTDTAQTAWNFFHVGNAVIWNPNITPSHPYETLLGAAAMGYDYFTEWNLGTYMFAILDAEKAGILPRGPVTYPSGLWEPGSTDRLTNITSWLGNRQLCSGLACRWYHVYYANASAPPETPQSPTDVADLGFLLIALDAVKRQRPEFTANIDGVYGPGGIERQAAENLVCNTNWAAGVSIYEWFVAHGFSYFGITCSEVTEALGALDAILNPSITPQVTTYGVTLPRVDITSEPILLGMLYLRDADKTPGFATLAWNVDLVQERRYLASGSPPQPRYFTGFSEGNTGLPDPNSYVYEWIVQADGSTWSFSCVNKQPCVPPIEYPIKYLKAAFGFYALHGTQYGLDFVQHLLGSPGLMDYCYLGSVDYCYREGIDENGRVVSTVVDATHGITLAAARHALEAPTLSTTFYTNPTSGTVTANGVTKTNGATGTYSAGHVVHVVANPPTGYHFSHWETNGTTVDDEFSQDTYMMVSNNGWLKAHYSMNTATVTVTVTSTLTSVYSTTTGTVTTTSYYPTVTLSTTRTTGTTTMTRTSTTTTTATVSGGAAYAVQASTGSEWWLYLLLPFAAVWVGFRSMPMLNHLRRRLWRQRT